MKYLQHPLTMIFNKHIEVTEVYAANGTKIYLDFKEGRIRDMSFIQVKLVEDVERSKELEHKIMFPTHPIADLLTRKINRIIIDDDFSVSIFVAISLNSAQRLTRHLLIRNVTW